MELLKELEALGVDIEEGMGRVMGDADLYTMMFDMFVSAAESTVISPSEFDGADLEELIRKIHSLKGTTGNLSIQPLFSRYNESLTLLREGKPAQAKVIYEELVPIQAEIIACIKKHKG